MAVVQGSFSHMNEPIFIDCCSKTRHFFANRGWCQHWGYNLTWEEWFKQEYAKLESDFLALYPPKYPKLFNIKKDDDE